MKKIARILALIWALWWTLFGLLAGIGEGLGFIGTLIHMAVPGLVFLFTVIIAWRWELVGGIILLLEGAAAIFFYLTLPFDRDPLIGYIFTILTIALPPVLSGLLLLIGLKKTTTSS